MGGRGGRAGQPDRQQRPVPGNATGGAVIAEGTPDQLKSSVGGEHLEIALSAGADIEAAVVAVKPYATGSIQAGGDGRRLSVPVAGAEGLTTRVVRALDDAGVQVNDVTIRRASLDDVFLCSPAISAAARTTAKGVRQRERDNGELVPARHHHVG